MRSASDVDRQPPGGDAYTAFSSEQGAFEIALANLVIAGTVSWRR
jgi:purine nucleoside permease